MQSVEISALLHCMYSVVTLTRALCASDVKKLWEGQGMCLWYRELHLQPVNRSMVVTFACPRSGLYCPQYEVELCIIVNVVQ